MKNLQNVVMFSNASSGSKDLIEAMQEYTKQEMNNKGITKFTCATSGTKDEREKLINQLYFSEIQRRSGYTLKQFDDNIVEFAQNRVVNEFAQTVDRILIDAIMPIVFDNSALNLIAEMHYAGYGQSFKFDIEDPTLYKVSKLDRRMKHGMTQEKERSTVAINTDSYAITTITNLPQVLLGESMIAKDIMRSAMSVQRKVYQLTISKFVSTMEAINIPALISGNYSEADVITKLQTISAYNNNKGVIIGDPVALKVVLPTSQNTRILLQDEFNTTLGYMSTFNQYDVLALPPVAADDGAFGLIGLPKNRLYIISPTARKLIHVALGASMNNTDGEYDNANLSILSTLRKEIGVEVATNQIGAKITTA